MFKCVHYLYTFKCVHKCVQIPPSVYTSVYKILYTSKCVHRCVQDRVCTHLNVYTSVYTTLYTSVYKWRWNVIMYTLVYTLGCVQYFVHTCVHTWRDLYTLVYTLKCVQIVYTLKCVQCHKAIKMMFSWRIVNQYNLNIFQIYELEIRFTWIPEIRAGAVFGSYFTIFSEIGVCARCRSVFPGCSLWKHRCRSQWSLLSSIFRKRP